MGTIVKCRDGSYNIGPFPDISGPFETTAAFFTVWSAHAKFPKPRDEIQRGANHNMMNQLLSSIEEFPVNIKATSDRFSPADLIRFGTQTYFIAISSSTWITIFVLSLTKRVCTIP